jgi:hypothetical protein
VTGSAAETMALSESAVSELSEVMRSGDAVDLICESVRMVLRELIDTERKRRDWLACYQRTDSRVNRVKQLAAAGSWLRRPVISTSISCMKGHGNFRRCSGLSGMGACWRFCW